jgi:phosphosulfolactate synthase
MTDRAFDTYLRRIGVAQISPATVPFDPGLAPVVLESHLEQSAHLMLSLKISMACWQVGKESAARRKLAAARAAGVEATAGGGPYEVAVAQGELESYLDLCADAGFAAIECGAGFTDPGIEPERLAELARSRGLAFDFELGGKHDGPFDESTLDDLLLEGERWLAAGARRLVVEARESASEVGLFDGTGRLNHSMAERLVEVFGHPGLIFEAPTKSSQFALMGHFGPAVQLGNVPLAELLRVEIYRRGLHSDAFGNSRLRPSVEARTPRGLL